MRLPAWRFRFASLFENWSELRKSNSLSRFGKPEPNQSAKLAQKMVAGEGDEPSEVCL
jgi:hypothetical protein